MSLFQKPGFVFCYALSTAERCRSFGEAAAPRIVDQAGAGGVPDSLYRIVEPTTQRVGDMMTVIWGLMLQVDSSSC